MTTSGSWMPQLLVLSPRSGGPFKEATGRIQKRQPTTARPVPWANSGRFRRGFVPITCPAVLDLGLPEGRSLGLTLGGWEGPWAWLSTSSLCWSRVHAPGLVLSLGAKVDSKQTPSQGKASSDRFDPGSFFLPCFWKGGLGEGNDVAQLRIGVGLGGALLPPHGRRRARSLDDGILVKLSGIGCDTVFEGASAQGDFTVSWVAPGIDRA